MKIFDAPIKNYFKKISFSPAKFLSSYFFIYIVLSVTLNYDIYSLIVFKSLENFFETYPKIPPHHWDPIPMRPLKFAYLAHPLFCMDLQYIE